MPLDPEIKAAIEAAVAAAVAPVIQAANESVEGLKKKNSELLSEKKALQEAERKRKADADTAQALRAADKFLTGNSNAASIPAGVIRATDIELFVNRSLIQDPVEYRRLKTVAEEQKKRMRIVDDHGADVPNVQPAVHRFDHKGTTYLSSHYIEQELGGPNGYARLRSENPNQKFHAFRDLNGIDAEVRAAHDAAMEAGDD